MKELLDVMTDVLIDYLKLNGKYSFKCTYCYIFIFLLNLIISVIILVHQDVRLNGIVQTNNSKINNSKKLISLKLKIKVMVFVPLKIFQSI